MIRAQLPKREAAEVGHPETATGGALAAQRSQHLLASPQMLRRTARVRRGYDRIMEDGTRRRRVYIGGPACRRQQRQITASHVTARKYPPFGAIFGVAA
jgi:hypothetical protein